MKDEQIMSSHNFLFFFIILKALKCWERLCESFKNTIKQSFCHKLFL